MLTVTRRQGETIRIGDDVTVIVQRTGKKVKLSIDAPATTLILRGELKPHDQPRIERHAEPDETSPE